MAKRTTANGDKNPVAIPEGAEELLGNEIHEYLGLNKAYVLKLFKTDPLLSKHAVQKTPRGTSVKIWHLSRAVADQFKARERQQGGRGASGTKLWTIVPGIDQDGYNKVLAFIRAEFSPNHRLEPRYGIRKEKTSTSAPADEAQNVQDGPADGGEHVPSFVDETA